jgi:hypothetical protein
MLGGFTAIAMTDAFQSFVLIPSLPRDPEPFFRAHADIGCV